MILTVKLGLTSQFLASRVNIIVILIFMKNILASFVFINIQILDYTGAIKMIALLCIIINQNPQLFEELSCLLLVISLFMITAGRMSIVGAECRHSESSSSKQFPSVSLCVSVCLVMW